MVIILVIELYPKTLEELDQNFSTEDACRQYPDWKDWETLTGWPDWFKEGRSSPTGRYSFTSVRHYTKGRALMPAGLLGPVQVLQRAGAYDE